jgi:tetratricopeptide (TPR) repeat protein
VLLSGFRDRSGTLRAESGALDDALRLELQAVPGLRVIDVGDQPEQPVDSLRKRYQADWVIRGALDRIGDSVGATVRVIDASNGAEVRGGVLRQASPGTLQVSATALSQESLFGTVRYALDSVLLDRWLLGLGTDSATADLRRRAREIRVRSTDALVTIGPRRMLEELALADSLLAVAQARSPSSALPPYERALLGREIGFELMAARQSYPDATWLPQPSEAFRKALPFANAAVQRAPGSADAWFARSRLYSWLFQVTQDPAWRDSALGDLRKASAIAGGRPDIWRVRAATEIGAGLWREALFSAQQGEASDHLHTNAEELLYRRSQVEISLGDFQKARGSCLSGAREFPGSPYFISCEAEMLGRSSADPADAARVLALADSLTEHGVGSLPSIEPDGLRLYAAAILARAGKIDSAGRVYDQVIGDWPSAVDPVLLLDAVYARQTMGDLDSALAIAARAVQLDPALGPSMERLPWYQPLRRHPGFPAAMSGISPTEAGRR